MGKARSEPNKFDLDTPASISDLTKQLPAEIKPLVSKGKIDYSSAKPYFRKLADLGTKRLKDELRQTGNHKYKLLKPLHKAFLGRLLSRMNNLIIIMNSTKQLSHADRIAQALYEAAMLYCIPPNQMGLYTQDDVWPQNQPLPKLEPTINLKHGCINFGGAALYEYNPLKRSLSLAGRKITQPRVWLSVKYDANSTIIPKLSIEIQGVPLDAIYYAYGNAPSEQKTKAKIF